MRRAVLAGILVLTGIALVPPPADAASTERIAGADRYATAAAVSAAHFSAGVPVVYIATGKGYADALAAGPAAARRGGPVLLVADSVPQPTAAELTRLKPADIVVVGGAASVSDAVVNDLNKYATNGARRVAGNDRYATAAAIARETFGAASTVFVASGEVFADALAGVPAASAAKAPMLLVTPRDVPGATANELRADGAQHVVILGGTASVGANAETQLRAIVSDVQRVAGADRATTSALVSTRTFGSGVGIAYLASGASFADALAGGPVASLDGAPILLAGGNCVARSVIDELNRLNPARIILLGGTSTLGSGVETRDPCPGPGSTTRTPSPGPLGGPVWNDAAPDPDIVRFGSTWYAFTTGTTWGNNIGVLVSDAPNGGWHTTTGKTYGSTAMGAIPSWQNKGTQWAPGVYAWGGRYVMFFAAQQHSTGKWCISVATSSSPTGPFDDRSTGPMICQLSEGGSIDPQPFVDADNHPWLLWKNNDGSSKAVSRVWSAPLATDGTSLAGGAREILAKDTQHFPWMTTVDNPQMVLVDGVHYLFFSAGQWDGASYTVGYATCAGPAGPCSTAGNPILGSYGNVAGPGGGTVARDAGGNWWIAYHAWDASCTNDACGGKRKLYVAPLAFK
jgi:putative cell wall-binding protein